MALATEHQDEVVFDKPVTVRVQFKYLVSLPEKYEDSTEKYPLLIFLHGSGETGKDLHQVLKHGPPKLAEEGKAFPFIVVSPQTTVRYWNPDYLNALLDELVSTYRVDPDRIYLTGLSMGGYGTWSWAAAHPERFAAIVPICGGGNPENADRLKDLPIWVFHGAKDKDVKLEKSEEMVKAIKEAGGDPKFTVYPEAEHDSWTETYNNPELYTWLLSHKRGDTK
jgi:predicted peptidase